MEECTRATYEDEHYVDCFSEQYGNYCAVYAQDGSSIGEYAPGIDRLFVNDGERAINPLSNTEDVIIEHYDPMMEGYSITYDEVGPNRLLISYDSSGNLYSIGNDSGWYNPTQSTVCQYGDCSSFIAIMDKVPSTVNMEQKKQELIARYCALDPSGPYCQ